MKAKKSILILSLIYIFISILLWGKTGNILVDFSRESYIPYQLINGESLFKDIFLIYGAWGYIVNSLLYKINININLLMILAHIISYFIAILFYLIVRKYQNKNFSLALSIFFILTSIFSHSTFSFVTPYSFSTLWAAFGLFIAFYSILYNKKNILFLALGLILVNKIEFFTPAFLSSIAYLIYKKQTFKKEFLFILLFPFLTLISLLSQSFTFDDILMNLNYIKEMLEAKSLNYLYKGMGSFFEIEYFKYNCLKLMYLLIIAIPAYIFYKYNKKIALILLGIYLFFTNTNESFNLLGIINLFLSSYFIIKKQLNSKEILLLCFAFILSSKAIFAINSLTYSNFGYFMMILTTFILLSKIINKDYLKHFIIIFLIINYVNNLAFILLTPKTPTKTKVGTIYINNDNIEIFNKTNKFINERIKKDETFVILPEGQIFNLINNKKHLFYNSTFTPLDFETFKEQKLINDLKSKKPDYAIFYPRNTMDYGPEILCLDYAVDFCNFIMDNYTKTETIENNYKVLIYKRKTNEK